MCGYHVVINPGASLKASLKRFSETKIRLTLPVTRWTRCGMSDLQNSVSYSDLTIVTHDGTCEGILSLDESAKGPSLLVEKALLPSFYFHFYKGSIPTVHLFGNVQHESSNKPGRAIAANSAARPNFCSHITLIVVQACSPCPQLMQPTSCRTRPSYRRHWPWRGCSQRRDRAQ